MRWTTRASVAAVVAGAVVVGVSGAAAATAGKHLVRAHRAARLAPGKRPVFAAESPSALPPKYVKVSSGAFTVGAGAQASGTVTCPGKTVPYGGGVFVSTTALSANINTSIPLSNGWRGDVNNASIASTTFEIIAVCAKRNAAWHIVSGTAAAVPASSQTSTSVGCPAGTKVLGGGGFSNSGSTSVNLNSSIPVKSGSGKSATYAWRVDENNASANQVSEIAYAVCGRAAGYKIVTGALGTVAAGTQTSASVSCPAGKAPLGGGLFSTSGALTVNTNTTYATTTGWIGYENNANVSDSQIQAYAVCAGTK